MNDNLLDDAPSALPPSTLIESSFPVAPDTGSGAAVLGDQDKQPDGKEAGTQEATAQEATDNEKTLFQRNIAFFEEKKWVYAHQFREGYQPASYPVMEGESWPDGLEDPRPKPESYTELKIVNLDIGDRLLYKQDAPDEVEKQIKAYRNDPIRLHVKAGGTTADPLRSNRGYDSILAEGKRRKKATGRRVGEFYDEILVCHGIGLGYHVQPMIEAFKIRTLVITETMQDFLYYSLFIVDWGAINQQLEDQGGRLEIICSNLEAVESRLNQRLRDIAIGQLDGILIYKHYPSASLAKLQAHMINNFPYIGSNMGFFEDEIVMLIHSFQNFAVTNPAYYWSRRPRFEKNTPVIVVGSGPSVDENLDLLKEIQNRAIIIACGSALKVLLRNDIKPDFQVLIENTMNQEQDTQEINREYDVSDIPVLAAASVTHKALRYFKKRILFFRDFLSTEVLLKSKGMGTVDHSGPMVSNLGLRFAIGMGFLNIYLLGIDMGSRAAGSHHSRHSLYYDTEKRAEDIKKISRKLTNKNARPGNLGGLVIGNPVYDIAIMFKATLAERYPDRTFINCSDGVRIEQFIPKLFKIAVSEWDHTTKQTDLKKLYQELDYIEDGWDYFTHSYRQLLRKIKRKTQSDCQKLAECERFPDLVSYLYSEYMEDQGDADLDCFRRVLRGTLFIEVSAAYHHFRTMAETDFNDFFPWIKQFFINEIKDMHQITTDAFTSIEKRQVCDLRADVYGKFPFLSPHIDTTPRPLPPSSMNQTSTIEI